MGKEYENINKKQILLWLIARMIFFVILAAIIFVGKIILFSFDLGSVKHILELLYNIITLVILLPLGVNAFIMPFFQQKFWVYRINDDKIEIRHGVITKVLHVLPVARIQQITVVRSILSRFFGLSTIVLETAGNQQYIIGIEKETADRLAKTLNERVNLIAREDSEASAL